MKKVIVVLLVLALVLLVALETIMVLTNSPEIKDFKIVQKGNNFEISFVYANVKGGLESALFTIGCQIYRKNELIAQVLQTDLQLETENLKSVIQIDKTLENGNFKAIVPALREKDLKSGDKIKYFIFLIDGQDRKSNTIIYEFKFIEQWEI